MTRVTETASFDPELFAFLRELAKHNDRDWFAANKGRYEAHVLEPALAFIEDFGYRLQSISQQILSRTRLERVIQDFNLYEKERKTGIMEDLVERMRRDIEVQIVKGDAFRVAFTGQDPRTVMRVTERLASHLPEVAESA